MTTSIGRFSTRQQAVVMAELNRTRGQGWAAFMERAEQNQILLAALVERYGEK